MPVAELKSLDALDALGAYWRADWSEFDGRTLRYQLNGIRELIEAEIRGEQIDVEDYVEINFKHEDY